MTQHRYDIKPCYRTSGCCCSRIWKDMKGYERIWRICKDKSCGFGYEFWEISIKDIHLIYPVISWHILHIHMYPRYLSVYLSIMLSNRHIQTYILCILWYHSCLSKFLSKAHIQWHILCILCYPFCLSLHIPSFIHAHMQLFYPTTYLSYLVVSCQYIRAYPTYLSMHFIQRHI